MAGHIGAVNITVDGDVPFLSNVDVSFQVSASVEVDGVENEGERSEITSDSTVFVPSASKYYNKRVIYSLLKIAHTAY